MSEKKKDEPDKEKPKTCFVIMPFSDPEGYTPGHFARVYKHIIEPACKQSNFEPLIGSQVKMGNVIIADILERILNADMVVCDLSSRNPNVLYELGLRQAFDLPVTLMKDDVTTNIFDIQGIRYSPYKSQLRIDLVEEDISLLADSIRETYANRDKGVFSLVQILGRDKATIKQTDLAPDTLAILEAIKELRVQSVQKELYSKSNIPPILFSYILSFTKGVYKERMTRLSEILSRFSPVRAIGDYVYDEDAANITSVKVSFSEHVLTSNMEVLLISYNFPIKNIVVEPTISS